MNKVICFNENEAESLIPHIGNDKNIERLATFLGTGEEGKREFKALMEFARIVQTILAN